MKASRLGHTVLLKSGGLRSEGKAVWSRSSESLSLLDETLLGRIRILGRLAALEKLVRLRLWILGSKGLLGKALGRIPD